jgi:hypothetical protein
MTKNAQDRSHPDFLSRLKQPEPLILDGATGTELTRRGVDTGLPLWSANALLSDEGTPITWQRVQTSSPRTPSAHTSARWLPAETASVR